MFPKKNWNKFKSQHLLILYSIKKTLYYKITKAYIEIAKTLIKIKPPKI